MVCEKYLMFSAVYTVNFSSSELNLKTEPDILVTIQFFLSTSTSFLAYLFHRPFPLFYLLYGTVNMGNSNSSAPLYLPLPAQATPALLQDPLCHGLSCTACSALIQRNQVFPGLVQLQWISGLKVELRAYLHNTIQILCK